MTNLYDYEQVIEFINEAGEYVCQITDHNLFNEAHIFTFTDTATGKSIKCKYELNEKWGWKLLKLAKSAKLTESQIMQFDPQSLIGKTVIIDVRKGDKYANVWDTHPYDGAETTYPNNEDVPF